MQSAQPYSSIACILRDKHLLLYRRINTTYESDKLGFIGGKIEDHETPATAIVREIKEETSLIVQEDDLTFLTALEAQHRRQLISIHVFLVRDCEGEPINNEPDKCGGLHWHPISELPENVIPVIHDIVKLIPDHE